MVSNTGRTPDPRRIRRLKSPRSLDVVAGPDGTPVRFRQGSSWHDVSATRPVWRIDQHWWRPDAVRRDYFRVLPVDGPSLTIYHDLITDEWARQEY
jgi:hypothetical protein